VLRPFYTSIGDREFPSTDWSDVCAELFRVVSPCGLSGSRPFLCLPYLREDMAGSTSEAIASI
jgi:hypothetical protein